MTATRQKSMLVFPFAQAPGSSNRRRVRFLTSSYRRAGEWLRAKALETQQQHVVTTAAITMTYHDNHENERPQHTTTTNYDNFLSTFESQGTMQKK